MAKLENLFNESKKLHENRVFNIDYLGSATIGNCYHGASFVCVAYTEDERLANSFRHEGLHHGGVPIFTVTEEPEEEPENGNGEEENEEGENAPDVPEE